MLSMCRSCQQNNTAPICCFPAPTPLRLAVTTAEPPLPSSSPAVAIASPSTARHPSPTQAAASPIPAAASKDLPQPYAQAPAVKGVGQAATKKVASAAEAAQQVKPVHRRGRKGDPSSEPTAAEAAQTRGKTKVGRKRARNEEVNEGSPPTGNPLLAEAAAVALPLTEQKVPLKTMVPDSQACNSYTFCSCCLTMQSHCQLLKHLVNARFYIM
ncbi:TPA: hypothetical protein ACH3X1_015181 [Trebouxia sp. C0004]